MRVGVGMRVRVGDRLRIRVRVCFELVAAAAAAQRHLSKGRHPSRIAQARAPARVDFDGCGAEWHLVRIGVRVRLG